MAVNTAVSRAAQRRPAGAAAGGGPPATIEGRERDRARGGSGGRATCHHGVHRGRGGRFDRVQAAAAPARLPRRPAPAATCSTPHTKAIILRSKDGAAGVRGEGSAALPAPSPPRAASAAGSAGSVVSSGGGHSGGGAAASSATQPAQRRVFASAASAAPSSPPPPSSAAAGREQNKIVRAEYNCI